MTNIFRHIDIHSLQRCKKYYRWLPGRQIALIEQAIESYKTSSLSEEVRHG